MSIKGQGHSFTLVKVHSDFKVKCLTFGLYTQVSDSGPLGPLVLFLLLCVFRMEILLFNIHQVLKIVGGAKWEELNFHVYMQCFMKTLAMSMH